jgi:hypothetical protein
MCDLGLKFVKNLSLTVRLVGHTKNLSDMLLSVHRSGRRAHNRSTTATTTFGMCTRCALILNSAHHARMQ